MVLSEWTAVNYQRKLVAYGVHAGMYGGVFSYFKNAFFSLTKYSCLQVLD